MAILSAVFIFQNESSARRTLSAVRVVGRVVWPRHLTPSAWAVKEHNFFLPQAMEESLTRKERIGGEVGEEGGTREDRERETSTGQADGSSCRYVI